MIVYSSRSLLRTTFAVFVALSLPAMNESLAAAAVPDLARTVRPLSPEKSMATMQIAEGYSLELVAAEPMGKEPMLFVWDGNGRMYLAEMCTHMQEIDGKNQLEPRSHVVRLEDTVGAGRMDKLTGHPGVASISPDSCWS